MNSTAGKSADFEPAKIVRNMTTKPGVYRMLDAGGEVLYVGKAGNLKKRVSSYFTGKPAASPKTLAMVRQIRDIDVTITRNEGEALILENSLIKELRPRYNVLFRDDKSYPYIHLSEHGFPRLSFYRGSRRGKGRYFGPYPGAGAVRRTLNLLQKLFRIRQCTDAFFNNRSRPCLQYQIKRCSAPCVNYISREQYQRDVEHAVMFLEGRNEEVIEALTGPMQAASDALDFERAAQYRDQIMNLRRVQEEHHRSDPHADLDVIACAANGDNACILVLFIRNGTNLGYRTFFPQHARQAPPEEIVDAFMQQYYLGTESGRRVPDTFLTSHQPRNRDLLEQVLCEYAGRKVRIVSRPRGERARWLTMAQENAALALAQQINRDESIGHRLEALRVALDLPDSLERLECFDVSHIRGEATVAACVVFGIAGPVKDDYRRYNIKGIAAGDDYAAMAQAIRRRYQRLKQEEGRLPDILLIDGGKGQVNKALAVLEELQVMGVFVLGVAKGMGRRPGLETLILADGKTSITLPADSPALHLIQSIRDEAHRFAITGHRQQRGKARMTSQLEQIEGIGSKRRQQLIHYFGGLQGVTRAGVEELARVPGINKNLAQRIYDALHGGA
jgi:excinuclease ABC subunit C